MPAKKETAHLHAEAGHLFRSILDFPQAWQVTPIHFFLAAVHILTRAPACVLVHLLTVTLPNASAISLPAGVR